MQIALGKLSPLDDIAIVMPVAVATMTPIPLFICFIAKYIRSKTNPKMSILDNKLDESSVAITDIKSLQDQNENSKAYIP